MYSKNDYRYYLEHRLLVSDDYLAHYGVMGMKWGVRHDERRASFESKKEANNAKIGKYQQKLNTVGAKKRAAKAAKYQHKVDKLQRKASKATRRLAQGKHLSKRQTKKLIKYERYKAKVARNSTKNDKYQMKIAQLEKKNARLDKRITKENYKSFKQADLAKEKNPDAFNSSYKEAVKALKSQGSTADKYIVTAADKSGRVVSMSPTYKSGPLSDVNSRLRKDYESYESKKKKRG